MLAGTQGGKTSFLPWWLAREIGARGAGDYLAVTASYDLFKLKFLPEMRYVFEEILGMARWWAGQRVLELRDPETGQFKARHADDRMWGRVILRSAGSSGGLESATAKAAILDEAGQDEFTLEDWEAILRRLSLERGRVAIATTLYNVGWLKSELYDPWVEGDPDIDIIQFPSTLNPKFPRAEFERAKKRMQAWRFSMFYKGEYAKPASLIYGDFTDSMLVDPFAIPRDWENVVGVDFGGANTALLWLAEDPESGVWYAYRESLEGGKTTREHCASVKDQELGGTPYTYVGGAASETQQRADWQAEGVDVHPPPVGDVEAGIDRVVALIKAGQFRVFRGLRGLRDELGGYSRKTDSAGNPTDEILNKRQYHRLDALRYAATIIQDYTGPAAGETADVPMEAYTGRKRKGGLWR
jgi:hypothetical protein